MTRTVDDAQKDAASALAQLQKAVLGVPERKIIDLPRGGDGLFTQPDWSKMSEPELQDFCTAMQKRRMRAAHDADFADQVTGLPNTNDPEGDYLCRTCNKEFKGGCVAVKLNRKDLNTGFKSCNKYEIKCIGDPEANNPCLTVAEAGFVEGKRPWGCKNCSMKEASGFVDQLDRTLWCKRWAFTVRSIDCCAKNDNPTLPLNEDGTLDLSMNN